MRWWCCMVDLQQLPVESRNIIKRKVNSAATNTKHQFAVRFDEGHCKVLRRSKYSI